jgi:ADP-ribose pyrophosphatase
MKPARWMTLSSQQLVSTPVFNLHQHRRGHHQHGEHDFYVLQCPDWVNVIPLTADDRIVMVRQFRHGIEDFTLEIPGGMVDPEDHSPREAARREMWEETGYDGEDLVALGQVHPNPAMQGNRCHCFVANNVQLTRKPQLDGVEEIEVVLVPRADIKALIASGEITHALVITAFAFLDAYGHPR